MFLSVRCGDILRMRDRFAALLKVSTFVIAVTASALVATGSFSRRTCPFTFQEIQ